MITNLFVPFELAELMKEKGFDEDCMAWYSLRDSYNNDKKDFENIRTPAPTYQQCTDWLREKHGMVIAIAVFKHKESNQELNYWPKIHFLISDVVSTDTADWEGGDSVDYYQALAAGIEQALTLI